jgi:hypothetical protein
MRTEQEDLAADILVRLGTVLAALDTDAPSPLGHGWARGEMEKAREALRLYRAHANVLDLAIESTAAKVAERYRASDGDPRESP